MAGFLANPVAGLLPLMGLVAAGVALQLTSAKGLERLRWLMEWPAPQTAYRHHLGGLLDRIDRALTPRRVAERPDAGESLSSRHDWLVTPLAPDRAAAERAGRAPLGWTLLDLCLLLALAYPVLFLVGQWLGGGEGRLGDLVLLPVDVAWWARPAALGALALFAASFAIERILPTPAKLVLRLVSMGLVVALVVAGAGLGAVAVAGTVALALEFAGTVAGAVALAVAVAVALPVAGAVALGLAVAGAVALVVAFALAVVVAGAVTVAAAYSVRRNRALAGYGALLLLLAGLLAAAAALAGPLLQPVATLLIFLGVLPLLNAAFDFASIGLTRYLLRLGTRVPPLATLALGAFDLLAALGFFTLLGVALIAAIHGLGALAGASSSISRRSSRTCATRSGAGTMSGSGRWCSRPSCRPRCMPASPASASSRRSRTGRAPGCSTG